ncbi:sensor histidine kinase [Sporolactobacillus shoreicorticis]|uniref:histidine kinase n=1 Tax=Sporolactobacillus shoreicorticis TaxID=1923877 RepID=A0ABW5S5T5_9BACL|nr:sensor histidine kinase [Sporolactobacillus shoreicorticis]MCO7126237.1 sensor histidine kinase [Sporolactobacillus shoreicorticis]
MKIISYLWDQRTWLIYYITSSVFLTVFLIVVPSLSMKPGDLFYLHAVLFFFFILFLLIGYCRRSRYLSALIDAVECSANNRLLSLPSAQTQEQQLIHHLLHKIDQDHHHYINQLHAEIEENKDFILAWVHEVKTPIAAGKMLLAASSEKTKDQLIDKFEDELDEISRDVERALYYSRTERFSNDYFISEYELKPIISQLLKKNAKLFIAKRIKVEMNNLRIQVLTDKKWLLFIIDQIFSNALKYMNVQGSLKITGERRTRSSVLIIKDNGCGIAPEDIRRVFEKGFTGSLGRQTKHATGIGLYLSDTLMKKLGHQLSLASVPGTGTTVTLEFPDHVDYTEIGRGASW